MSAKKKSRKTQHAAEPAHKSAAVHSEAKAVEKAAEAKEAKAVEKTVKAQEVKAAEKAAAEKEVKAAEAAPAKAKTEKPAPAPVSDKKVEAAKPAPAAEKKVETVKPAAPEKKAEAVKPAPASEKKAEPAKSAPKAQAVVKPVPEKEATVEKKAEPVKEEAKVPEKKAEPVKEEAKVPEKKETKAPEKKTEPVKKAEEKKTEPAKKAEEKKAEPVKKAEEKKAEPAPKAEEKKAEPVEEKKAEPEKPAPAPELPQPRRSVAFIGSECFPFVKTGGLGDVMYALPKALISQNCDVRVIIPRYKCIKEQWQEKMVYRGSFDMDLCSDGKSYYVGIMEYVWDGVVYDFIDNEEFFSEGNPYTNLVDDIPKFCYFSKAALAALNYLNWIPDVIHCHDWQAALVPVYLREMFQNTPLGRSKTVLTIHNLRFQGVYNIPTIKYWTNLPDYVFNKDALAEHWTEANMLKGGLTYTNMITTVSGTYAHEIQTPEYGEGLDAHLRYHSGKLRGIVNGIDCDIWNPNTDKLLSANYNVENVIEQKKKNKAALQEELGLEQDDSKMVLGLVSRLTNQKGLDLVNAIIPQVIDGNTQFVVLGTGEPEYENSFRYYENENKGTVCSSIMYDEARSHKIYAGCDALLVPSRFEPCGLTQLIAMHYGTIPIVRETGGLKDTVLPYNKYTNEGNGFTFDRYESGLLLDAINRAKTLFFTQREYWDEMVKRDMKKDVSWDVSAKQYRQLYLDLTT